MITHFRSMLAPIKGLLAGTSLFMAGNSLLGVVLPLCMEAAGYSVALTGFVMSAYYLGLALGGVRSKGIIRGIGHIRAFAVFAAVTAAVCLAYSVLASPIAWVLLRIINGFCIAGMTTAIESWLNERSDNKTRGRVLGYYMLAYYLAVALGQTMVNLTPVAGSEHFMLSAALIGLALVPVAVTRLVEPDLADAGVLSIRQLFEASRIGVVGACVAGMLVGSFYALGVVFGRQIGMTVSGAAFFMSTVVLGSLISQVPVGILADKFDRRLVMSVMLLAVGSTWGILATFIDSGLPYLLLLVVALAFGGAISSIYPLCVAQTFDRLDRQFYVAASGRLLMVYSIGATVGPLLASGLMSIFGPYAFFVFESATAVLYAAIVLVSTRRHPLPPEEEREKFVPLPDISPVANRMDPRTEPQPDSGPSS